MVGLYRGMGATRNSFDLAGALLESGVPVPRVLPRKASGWPTGSGTPPSVMGSMPKWGPAVLWGAGALVGAEVASSRVVWESAAAPIESRPTIAVNTLARRVTAPVQSLATRLRK